MIKCKKCNRPLTCMKTYKDPIDGDRILRRRTCPQCGMVYLTREETYEVRKKRRYQFNGKEKN